MGQQLAHIRQGSHHVVGLVVADRRAIAVGTAAAAEIDEETGVAEIVERSRLRQQPGLAGGVTVEEDDPSRGAFVRDVPGGQPASPTRIGVDIIRQMQAVRPHILGGSLHRHAVDGELHFFTQRQRLGPVAPTLGQARVGISRHEMRHGAGVTIGQQVQHQEGRQEKQTDRESGMFRYPED